jgi:hypothetical protein
MLPVESPDRIDTVATPCEATPGSQLPCTPARCGLSSSRDLFHRGKRAGRAESDCPVRSPSRTVYHNPSTAQTRHPVTARAGAFATDGGYVKSCAPLKICKLPDGPVAEVTVSAAPDAGSSAPEMPPASSIPCRERPPPNSAPNATTKLYRT